MGDVPDSDALAGGQLAQIIDKQATMATDIAVILERTSGIKALEVRVAALERFRAALAGLYAAALAVGAVVGWLISVAVRR